MRFETYPLQNRGFSLVELSIAVVILSIMLTLGISAMTVHLDNAAHSATQRKADVIKEALTTYLGKYRRLPCPDLSGGGGGAGSGDDDRTTAGDATKPCAAMVGTVPYTDLGLSRDAVLDGWENFYTYALTTDPAAAPDVDWSVSAAFAVGKPGTLIALSRNPATNATTTDLTSPERAVVVLVSHGPNGLGAFTVQGTQNVLPTAGTDEAENADADNTFVVREPTTTNVATYGAYDDKVYFVRASELVAPLVKDGALRSAEGETRKQLTDTADAVIGASIASATLPATYTMPNDGWGSAMTYTVIYSPKVVTTTPAGLAFSITSPGPDRAPGTNADNVVWTVTIDTLKTVYAKAGTLTAGP